METNLTKRQIKNAVTKDTLKPAIENAYLDAAKKVLRTCNNGNCVINYKVECSDDDRSGFILPESFQSTKKGYTNIEIKDNQVISNLPDNTQKSIKTDQDLKYPNIEGATPDKNENSFTIGLNLDLLKDICNAVPADITGFKYIKLYINTKDNRKPIIFEQNNERPTYNGLIMPVKLVD